MGKNGDFARGLYNAYCQNHYDWKVFAIPNVIDGEYHTYTTEWRSMLKPLPGVTDDQVTEHEGYWWVNDPSVPFESYLGNPVKRLAPDEYAVCAGRIARHWIDGIMMGENTNNVPSMAAQLNVGVWLPEWAGPAPWKRAKVRFASIKIWQYDDEGDVRGILKDDITNNIE